MNQKGFTPLIIVVILAFILGAGYSFYLKTTNTSTPYQYSQPSPKPASTNYESTTSGETANWKTYTNQKLGFSIKYPSDKIRVDESSDGSLKLESISYTGNPNDSLSLIFGSLSLEGKTLKDFVNGTINDNIKNGGKVTFPLTALTIGNTQGYKFAVNGTAFVGGNVEYTYIPISNGRVIEIEDYLWSTSSEKVHQLENQILSTFKFIN